ncbi:MAG: hypothetical protein ABSD29_04780 [Verrucomicrobiota bacterium]|jgi:autotransporter-associated beta strand protein
MKSQTNAPSVPSLSAFGRCILPAAVLAVGLLAAAFSGQAATPTYGWNNASGGEYGFGAYWTASNGGVSGNVPGQSPNWTDIAQIGVSGTLTPGAVLYDQSSYAYGVGNLTVASAANSTASFTMSQGSLGITNSASNSLLLGNGNPSTATFTMNNGTLTCLRNASTFYQDFLILGNAANSSGTFTLNNGTANMLCGVEMGVGVGTTGTLNITGGTFIDNGWFGLARGNGTTPYSGSAIFNLTGGTVYLLRNPGTVGGTEGISFCQAGTNGVVNISGGTIYLYRIGFAAPGTGAHNDTETLNVSAGDIYLGSAGIVNGGQGGTKVITVNLSGGTFHTANMGANTGGTQGTNSIGTGANAGANWAWSAAIPANLTNSPAPGYITFAPEATRTITLSNVLSGTGGLALNNGVNGSGALDIENNETYTGTTTLNGGTLMGNGQIQGSVIANAGAIIAPGGANTPGTLTLATSAQSLTLNANSTNIIRLSSDPTQIGNNINDLLADGGSLTLPSLGQTYIKIVPIAPLSVSSGYTVMQYGGTSLAMSDAAKFKIVSDNQRYSFNMEDPSMTYPSIKVDVSGNSGTLVWKGGFSPNPNTWDHTTTNWYNTASSKQDVMYNGDAVIFDDTASVHAVTVSNSESPLTMTMSNSLAGGAFTFSGAGPLGGILDMEGTGALILTMTNVPTFSYVTNDDGTLVLEFANGAVNTISSTILDNGAGLGTIVQGGTNTLLLNANNSAFYGTLGVTNGILQYAAETALGADTLPLYATNGGSLDVRNVPILSKSIVISGNGYNGQAALMSSSGSIANEGVHYLTLTNDASIGAASRFDIYGGGAGGKLTGNGYKLTELGPGTHIINAIGDTGLGNIHIVAGRLGFQGSTSLGDPTKTLTVESNATLTLYAAVNPVNGSGYEDKVLVLNGSATVDSAGAANNFQGAVTLNGTNNFGLRSSLSLWGPVGGAGSMVVSTNDSVGSGSGVTLYLEGTNTYTGVTIINPDAEVSLGANAVLGPSPLIVLNAGSTLDVSAQSSFSFGNGQEVIGIGTVLGQTINFGSGSTLSVGLSSAATSTLAVNNAYLVFQAGSTNIVKVNPGTVTSDLVTGLYSVTYGGTLVVTKIGAGSFAAGNSFQLFSATTYNPSSFAALVLPNPGPGLAWDTSHLTDDGSIRIIARPQITGADRLGDGNIELTFTADASSTSYILWATTNVALPLASWTQLSSGTITSSPLTIQDLTATNYPQRFYTISVP